MFKKRIYHKYFSIFGIEFHIQYVPKEFREDTKIIYELMDLRKFDDAEFEHSKLKMKWGPEPEVCALGTEVRFKKFRYNNKKN